MDKKKAVYVPTVGEEIGNAVSHGVMSLLSKERNNVADLTVDTDRRTAGIAGMTVFDPHFRAKH